MASWLVNRSGLEIEGASNTFNVISSTVLCDFYSSQAWYQIKQLQLHTIPHTSMPVGHLKANG